MIWTQEKGRHELPQVGLAANVELAQTITPKLEDLLTPMHLQLKRK